MRKGDNKGGTEGSSVEYVGYKVKNLKETLAKMDAAGFKPMPGPTSKQAFLLTPDAIKVRLTEDRALSTPVASDMIQMDVSNVKEAQAWYQKWFGAKLVKDGKETVADIPGHRILFVEANGPAEPTKGRAFDRFRPKRRIARINARGSTARASSWTARVTTRPRTWTWPCA